MKHTRLHTNAIILSVVLAALQGVILYIVNGDISGMIAEKDLGALAIVFSPTGGHCVGFKGILQQGHARLKQPGLRRPGSLV